MNEEKSSWLDRPISSLIPRLNVETLLIILILVLAVFSRLYILGARTMSHDEVNHVVPSYELYQGQGYAYDPVTHGPLQFHLIALSFFLFGDTDFTARLPHALLGLHQGADLTGTAGGAELAPLGVEGAHRDRVRLPHHPDLDTDQPLRAQTFGNASGTSAASDTPWSRAALR